MLKEVQNLKTVTHQWGSSSHLVPNYNFRRNSCFFGEFMFSHFQSKWVRETVDQTVSVTGEDPLGCSPDLGCSILSPLHASDSSSFLSACDSSAGVGGGWGVRDNQRWIVKKKTNPWGGLLFQTMTSVSCKHEAQSCSIMGEFPFFFFTPFSLPLPLDGQALCSYYKLYLSPKKMSQTESNVKIAVSVLFDCFILSQ